MRHRRQDLERLEKVTEAGWLAASQALRKKAGEERIAASRVAALARDRKRCLDLIGREGAADAAQVVSTAKWLRWSDGERARLNIRLARLRAEMAREQEAARKAFAKHQALQKLLKRLRLSERR